MIRVGCYKVADSTLLLLVDRLLAVFCRCDCGTASHAVETSEFPAHLQLLVMAAHRLCVLGTKAQAKRSSMGVAPAATAVTVFDCPESREQGAFGTHGDEVLGCWR
jgi:hypothetical protein